MAFANVRFLFFFSTTKQTYVYKKSSLDWGTFSILNDFVNWVKQLESFILF